MRPVSRLSASVAGIAVALAPALVLPTGAAPAAAIPDIKAAGPTVVPFTPILRRCDFSSTPTVTFGAGSGYSIISTDGSKVMADIYLTNAGVNKPYIVRLVQLPRTGIRCAAGDPGTSVATMVTNAGEVGTFHIEGDLMPGATQAFVQLEGAPAGSVPSAEVYSSDFAAPV